MPSGDGEIRRLADWFHAVRVGNDTLLITLLFARRTVSPPIEPRLRWTEIEYVKIEIEAKKRGRFEKVFSTLSSIDIEREYNIERIAFVDSFKK